MAISGHKCVTSWKKHQNKWFLDYNKLESRDTMAISEHKCETSVKKHKNKGFRL